MFNNIQQNFGGAYGARLARVRASFFKVAWVFLLLAANGPVSWAQEAPQLQAGVAEGNPGGHVSIPVSLQSAVPVVAAQFDLAYDVSTLDPAGVSSGAGLNGHVLDFEVVEPGVLRVVVTTDSLTPLDVGPLVDIGLNIAIDALDGDYPLVLSEVVLADGAGLEVGPASLGDGLVRVSGDAVEDIPALSPPLVGLLVLLVLGLGRVFLRSGVQGVVLSMALGTLLFASTIRALTTPGDANDDGLVNTGDIPVIVAQILERAIAPGDPDCNQDSQVDVLDTVCVVEMANEPPTLDLIADQSTPAEQPFELTATANDPDLPADTLTFSLDVAPAGMSIGSDSGLIEWTPTSGQLGDHGVTVRVADADGLFDTTSFTVTVALAPANSAPDLLLPGNRNIPVDVPFSTQLFATDPDPGDTLTFSVVSGPVGLTVDDDGLLEWTPGAGNLGPNEVEVMVEDAAGETDAETFTITVYQPIALQAANAPPVLGIPDDQTLLFDTPLSVSATGTDPDGDDVSFSLVNAPAGMTIDPDTGAIDWTPGFGQIGLHDVAVKLTDEHGAADFGSFVVEVRNVNSAPVANDDIYEARMGVPLTVNLPGVLDNDTDPNGDALTAMLVDDAMHGELTLNTDGSFEYLLEPPDLTTPVELELLCDNSMTPESLGSASVIDSEYQGNETLVVGDVDNDGDLEIVGKRDLSGETFLQEVWIMNAADCTEQFQTGAAFEQSGTFDLNGHVGLLDIDGDGDLEIIGPRERYPLAEGGAFDAEHLLAIHHDGTLAWPGNGGSETSTIFTENTAQQGYNNQGPTFTDLEGDGTTEIVMASSIGFSYNTQSMVVVYNAADGSIKWEYLSDVLQSGHNTSRMPYVADLDLDGTMEVIVHNSVIDHTGALEFKLPSLEAPGTTAEGHLVLGIGNFDDDPYPELVGRDGFNYYLFEHDGTTTWEFAQRNTAEGQIAVADFDGDGELEFADVGCIVYGFSCSEWAIQVFNADGALLWDHSDEPDFHLDGGSQNQGNITAFDANRDGAFDLVFRNDRTGVDTLYIYDGRDGSVLASIPARHYTVEQRFVTVADVNGDGHAELINSYTGGIQGQTEIWTGSAANPLPAAPPYRHQWNFHEAYVNDDLTIPTTPVPHWLRPGLNGYHLISPEPHPLIGADDSFTYKANDGALDSNIATVTLDILPAGNPPQFLSEPDALTTRGFTYRYAPVVVDPDLGDAVSFQLMAAPAGMTINPATGEINWLPDTIGIYPVTILATDTIGFAVSQAWDLEVGEPVVVPDVVGLPEATAEADITDANLVVGAKVSMNHPAIPAGSVYDQHPIAGAVAEFGAAVKLFLSLGPGPADTDDDGDGFSENEGDCNDDDDTVFPGAADADGDGIDQDCDGIDGNGVLDSIVISPVVVDVLTDQNVNLKAYGIFEDGTSQNLTSIAAWTNGPSFSSPTAGAFPVTASRDAIEGNATVNVHERVPGDDVPPIAQIDTPLPDAQITEPVDVIGTASDDNFLKYELAYAIAGSEAFTTFASSTSPVTNDVLGQFDPTLLINDLYTIRLTVYDLGGNAVTDEIVVQVDEDLKVGNFTLTYTDVEIPLSGIPISVNRTYDSRNKEKGDFGVGWTLDIQSMDIRTNRVLGTGWQVVKSGLSFLLVPSDVHVAVIRLPNGKLEIFNLQVTPSVSPLVPFPPFANSASFLPRAGTLGTLQSLDNNNLSVLGAQPGEILLVDDISSLEYNPQRFRYTRPDGTEIVINKTSGVESVKEPNGNTLVFTENAITHSTGKQVLFERDAAGRITKVTDANGDEHNYIYDANGDLRSVTDNDGDAIKYKYNFDHGLLEIIDPLDRLLARNEYDDDGRLLSTTNADGRTVELQHLVDSRQEIVTDADGSVTIIEYDSQGNVISATDELGNTITQNYDSQGNKISTTNAVGETTTRTFDANNNMLTETDPLGNTTTYTYGPLDKVTSVTDPLGHTTVYTYNSAGKLLTETAALGHVISHAYDANGNRILTQNAAGETITMAYDAFGNMTFRADAAGNVEGFVYDANGNRVSHTDRRGHTSFTEYNQRGLPTEITDPLGNVTQVLRDAVGNVIGVIDPLGNSSTAEVDAQGKELAYVSAAGDRFERNYDIKGNLTQVTSDTGSAAGFTYDALDRMSGMIGADGNSTVVEFDQVGRVIKRIDARGNATEFEYDDAGRQTRIIDPLGNETTFTYDDAGNQLTRTDPLGNTWTFTYDELNRRVQTTNPDATFSGVVYDALGRVIKRIDSLGRETDFVYDANGNLVSVTDPLGGITSYAYDEEGNQISRTDANSNVTLYAYDANNRLVQETLPDGTTHNWSYDAAGNRVQQVDANGDVTNFDFDANGRQITKFFPDASEVTYTYTASNVTETITDGRGITAYAYDDMNRRSMVTNPDGSTVEYDYDAAGNLLTTTATVPGNPAVVTTFTYDELNRLEFVEDNDGNITTYTYDSNGNLATVTNPNGVVTSYSYDSLNRLLEIEHHDGTSPIERYSYTLDAVGNRTRVEQLDGSHSEYEYDDLDRLVRETQRDASSAITLDNSYTYDPVGNRLTLTDEITSSVNNYTYDAGDRLLTAGGTAYVYDANGNTLAKLAPDGITSYSYDFENRLVEVNTGLLETYAYDDYGHRVSSSGPGGTVNYLVDTINNTGYSQALTEYDDANTPMVEYTFGLDLISQNRVGPISYYHYDGVSSTRLLSNEFGVVTDRYDYDGFGGLIFQTGATENSHLFTGERLDANSGFYLLRARYYAPEFGRFITRDPYKGVSTDPRSLHRYTYVSNNPILFTDYSGNDLSLAGQMVVAGLINVGITLIVIGFEGDAAKQNTTGRIIYRLATAFIFGALTGGVSNLASRALALSKPAVAGYVFKNPVLRKLESAAVFGLVYGLPSLGVGALTTAQCVGEAYYDGADLKDYELCGWKGVIASSIFAVFGSAGAGAGVKDDAVGAVWNSLAGTMEQVYDANVAPYLRDTIDNLLSSDEAKERHLQRTSGGFASDRAKKMATKAINSLP